MGARPVAIGALLLALSSLAGGCGGDGSGAGNRRVPGKTPVVLDAGPMHVHGLGVDPKDRAVFMATHTGLFRLGRGSSRPRRVADQYQDTMGFVVVGPNHFLASGHPGGSGQLPPFLGLIESNDAGRSWRSVSLLGEFDFHILEARGRRLYGFGTEFDTRQEALLVSYDSGESCLPRPHPNGLVSAAADPSDPNRLVASSADALWRSSAAGRSWKALAGPPGLVVWPSEDALYAVDSLGNIRLSRDGGGHWVSRGNVGGQPAAVTSGVGADLYVALHDGAVKHSRDRGASWAVSYRP